MHIHFKPVDAGNIITVLKLHIKEWQSGMVETVAECLDEAGRLSLWRPVAIFAAGEAIGFAMYGRWEEEGKEDRVWLDRFFIDEHFQGLGYAKAVLPILLEKITGEYGCQEIYLSVYDNNFIAIHLYQVFGFSFNGEVDTKGEKIMVRAGRERQ